MAGIVFAAIARGPIILVSHRRVTEDFQSSCASVLPQIPQYNTKTAYSYGGYEFLVIVEDGLVYLCASKPEFGRRLGFSYLTEVKRKFTSGSLSFRAINAGENELDRDFRKVLEDQMEKFNRGEGDSVTQLHERVEEVKGVMKNNIEKVLERGDKIDNLLDKTSDLEASATQFRGTARKVRRHMQCKNVKMWIILILVIAVIITIIVLFSTNIIPTGKHSRDNSVVSPTTTTTHSSLNLTNKTK